MTINENLLIEISERCDIVLENYDSIKDDINYYERQIARYKNSSDFKKVLDAFIEFTKKSNYYINLKREKDRVALYNSIIDAINN